MDKKIDEMLTWDIDGHKEPVLFKPELKKAIKTLLEEVCLDIIGDDPQHLEDGFLNPMPYEEHNTREKLRAEQRTKLERMLNGK